MKRIMPALFALTYCAIPIFPPFITLTAVTVPGVALLPKPVAYMLLGIMGIVAILTLIALLEPSREKAPLLPAFAMWVGAGVLSAILGFNPLGGIIFFGIFCLGVIWHVAILRFYRERNVSRAIWWAYLASGLVACAVAIMMVIARFPAAQYTIGHGRAIGTFILPGELAGYLIIYLPLAYVVARATRFRTLRTVAWAGFVLGGIALVLTFSRAGWMGLAAAAAFYLFATRNQERTRYALVPLAIGIAAVLIVFNAHHNPSENFTRLSIWRTAFDIIQRFPLTGVGPLDFASAYAVLRAPDGDATAFHAHSFLLTVVAELGIVGLVAVLWTWWRFVVLMRDALRTANPIHARLAIAACAGLVGTWVQGAIDAVSVVIFGLWLPTMALALVLAKYGLGEDRQGKA